MYTTKLIWHKKSDKREDDILLVYSWPNFRELLQLRRLAQDKKNQKWHVRSCSIDDNNTCEVFGDKWYYETLHGFDTVREFCNWLEEKVYVDKSSC